MVPQTSLPGYFLGAVRKGRLKRDEVDVGGKMVWAYTTDKKGGEPGTTPEGESRVLRLLCLAAYPVLGIRADDPLAV